MKVENTNNYSSKISVDSVSRTEINMKDNIDINYVTMIGAGSFGTSVARAIVENNRKITLKLWTFEKEVAQSINNDHENSLFLPGVELPSNIIGETSLREAVADSQVVIFATPSKVLYDISSRVKKYISDIAYIGYLSKGFCKVHNEILPISDTLARVFPSHADSIVAIYGPSHAEEVSQGFHTCLDIASVSVKARKVFIDLLTGRNIGCRETDDIRGVDLGTTLKNPAAIAAGILSMLPQCGDNLAGALIVEALGEMIKLSRVFNAREETLMGLSGLGDLVATSLSEHSRNRRFGKDIAKQILSSGTVLGFWDRFIMIFRPEYGFEKMSERLNYLAEGAYAIEPILELAEKNNIDMPVYKSLYEILLNKRDPKLLIETVKNPEKFDEIFERTKIHMSDRKRGLENKRGGIFNKTILKNSMSNLMKNSKIKNDLIQYRDSLLSKFNENADSDKYALEFTKKEYELFKKIDSNNIEKGLRGICEFYVNDITDNFHLIVYKIFVKFIKFLNFFNMLFTKNHSKRLFENNIQVTGNQNNIKKVNDTSNLVYVSTYRSYLDFAYINMAVDKFGLHIPRFFIERKIVKSNFKKFMLKLTGGYFIDSERLSNPVYKEVVENYLATLIEHGVQILFFPEIQLSQDGKIGNINKEFLSMIMDALFANTEEIALVPIEVSYYKKPHGVDSDILDNALSLRKVLDNRIKINFSEPIFASDFSNSDDTLSLLSKNINVKWKSDSDIFPHYILCRIILENNYKLNIDEANKYITESLLNFNIKKKFKAKHILKKGLDFILKNNIGHLADGELLIMKRDEIDYYSNLIYQ